jgi:hypothetical protein
MNNFDTLLNERFDSPNKLDEAILGTLKKAAGVVAKTTGRAAAGAAAGAVQGAQAAKAGGATRKRDIIKGALGGATKRAVVNPVARRVAAKKFGAKRADVVAKRASQKLNRPGEARPILGKQRAAAAANPKVVGGATTATIKKKETMKTDARHRDIIKNKPDAPRTKQKLDPVKDRDEIKYKVKQMHQAAEKDPVLKAKIAAKKAQIMKRRKDAALKNKFAGGGKPKPTTLAASLNVNFGQILQEKYEIEVELLEEFGMLNEVSPPGFEGTVKAMKKHKEIDNPYALSWYMKNQGFKSHKKKDGTDKDG